MNSFSLLNWNIMGHGMTRNPAYKKIRDNIVSHNADVVCLQETPRQKSLIRFLARNPEYKLYASESFYEKERPRDANSIFTKFPIINSEEMVFGYPVRWVNVFGWAWPSYVLWVDLNVRGKILRLYNCHLQLVGAGIMDRLLIMERIFQHAKSFAGPIVICGDMNTVTPKRGFSRRFIRWFHKIPRESLWVNNKYYKKDERYIFEKQVHEFGFTNQLDINTPTWVFPRTKIPLFGLKLDWLLTKNIQNVVVHLEATRASDHKEIFANITI